MDGIYTSFYFVSLSSTNASHPHLARLHLFIVSKGGMKAPSENDLERKQGILDLVLQLTYVDGVHASSGLAIQVSRYLCCRPNKCSGGGM